MVYLTTDTNKGNFWQRFHTANLTETDTLIVVGDTGLSTEAGYEAQYRMDWLIEQAYNVYVVSQKDNIDEGPEEISDDATDEEEEADKAVINLYGGRIYVINDIKYLIVNETTSLESIAGLEVDCVLATNFELFELVNNKIKYKHAYVSECDEAMIEYENIIVLNEKIVEIQSI